MCARLRFFMADEPELLKKCGGLKLFRCDSHGGGTGVVVLVEVGGVAVEDGVARFIEILPAGLADDEPQQS